jgi:hypothetical protein
MADIEKIIEKSTKLLKKGAIKQADCLIGTQVLTLLRSGEAVNAESLLEAIRQTLPDNGDESDVRRILAEAAIEKIKLAVTSGL